MNRSESVLFSATPAVSVGVDAVTLIGSGTESKQHGEERRVTVRRGMARQLPNGFPVRSYEIR